jgi:hypothetical protein
LRLKVELEKHPKDRGEEWEWAEMLRRLDNLQETEVAFRPCFRLTLSYPDRT